jgi:hypothetical protein
MSYFATLEMDFSCQLLAETNQPYADLKPVDQSGVELAQPRPANETTAGEREDFFSYLFSTRFRIS